jgi:hypothetical protein
MGPRSREAVVEVLGNLIDELQLQRGSSEKLHKDIRTFLFERVEQLEKDVAVSSGRVDGLRTKLEEALRSGRLKPA